MTAPAVPGEVWLAPHIHIARDGDDLVVLDVAADAYYCLPQAAGALQVADGGARLLGLAPQVIDALFAIGAVVDGAEPRRPSRYVAPARDLGGRVARSVGPREVWDLATSLLQALVLFRRRDLQGLVGGWEARPGRADPARLERRALVFRTLWPWSPVQGACLFQALVLRLFLRRGGLDADWIFGVRTWPFAAHCWIQSGDLVLNDLAERAGAYRPIMAV